jgi:hypothetical protein
MVCTVAHRNDLGLNEERVELHNFFFSEQAFYTFDFIHYKILVPVFYLKRKKKN